MRSTVSGAGRNHHLLYEEWPAAGQRIRPFRQGGTRCEPAGDFGVESTAKVSPREPLDQGDSFGVLVRRFRDVVARDSAKRVFCPEQSKQGLLPPALRKYGSVNQSGPRTDRADWSRSPAITRAGVAMSAKLGFMNGKCSAGG